MKKISAIVIIMLTLLLASCSALGMPDDEKFVGYTDKPDGEYRYSAVDLDVIAFPEEGKTTYEIQVGVRAFDVFNDDTAFDFASRLKPSLETVLGFDLLYRDYFYVTPTDAERYDLMIMFCYSRTFDGVTYEFEESKFGFFEYSHRYSLTPPSWIGTLEGIVPAITLIMDETYPSLRFKVDEDKIFSHFFFALPNDFDSENATQVHKKTAYFNLDPYSAEFLMWDGANLPETLPLVYKGAAPGWYIIAIALGFAAIVVLILITKGGKDKNVFRSEEPEEPDVLEGQISFDDIGKGDK